MFGPRAEQTRKYVAEQNYTWMKGRHQIRFGWHFQNEMLDVQVDRTPGENINFSSGATSLYDASTGSSYGALTRTGDNGANLFLGIAGAYQQTLQPGNLALRSRSAAGYIQDDWKITGNLTFNLGLRYDYFPMLVDANGMNAAFDWNNHAIVHTASISQMIANQQTNQAEVDAFQAIGVKFETPQQAGWKGSMYNVGERNFDPRVGLAYSMKIGRRTVVLRGGFGTFRWQLPARVYMSTMRDVPPLLGTVNYNINSATYTPDGLPNLGIRSAPTVVAGVNSQNAINANSVSPIARGVSLTAMDHDLPTSVSRQWNITMETEIVRNTRLRVAYIGNQGRNMDQTRDYNAQPGGYVWYATTHQPLPTGAYAAVAGRAYDSTTYGTISVWTKKSFSNFNGLQVELQRRFSGGMAFQAYYVLSNALYTGSQGETTNSNVPDPAAFLPGTVPTDPDAMNRFWNYQREASIPQHRFNWNVVYQLPIGKGKRFLASAGPVLDRIVGGWQLSGYATVQSRYWALPTGNWDLGTVQVYGFKYPIQDCRSTAANATNASCIPGYLYYNGYLPANLINTHNRNGVPNGIMGVPSNYQPAQQPLYPIPSGGCATGDPTCGTNNVIVPLNNGTTVRVAYGNNGLHPWRNQYVNGPWTTMPVNASLFKVVPIHERLKLRIQMDAFNALNMPGVNNVASATGFIAFNTSNNSPRDLQWSLRLNW
jgi:hypothetical protein